MTGALSRQLRDFCIVATLALIVANSPLAPIYFGVLKRDGNTKKGREQMLTFRDYNEVLGLKDVEEWETRCLSKDGAP